MAGTRFGHILGGMVMALMLLAGARPAHAAIGELGRAIPVCVLPAAPGMNAARLIRQSGGFDCTTPQTRFGGGDFWVRSVPLAFSDAPAPLEVRIASLWQDKVTLYALRGDGRLYRVTDDGHGITRHLQLGAIVQHQLPPSPAPLVRLMWHVEGAANLRGILVGARIARLPEADRETLTMAALYSGFVGLALALLIYNLAMWGALRYRFQPPYCVMVAALMAYAVSSSGALAWMVPTIANIDRLRINYLLLAIAAASAVAFARAFFEERVFAGWLRPASRLAMAAVLLPAVAFALFAPLQIWLIDRLYSITFMGLVAIVLPLLWRAWRLRSNHLWMFALAWAAPIVLAAARIAAGLNLLPWNFWLDNSTLVSMTVEALVSSLAIAYRIHLLSREHDDARLREGAARILADTDPLTGLLNRRAFLRDAIGRHGDQTLLLVDLDHFKRVNDTLGHDGGDEVLRIVARALQGSAPADALVARLGGEEFAILAGVASGLEPENVLARLRGERMPFEITVTASIGMCTGALLSEADWTLLYCIADRALFEAKAAGRDRVRTAFPTARAA
ncbi:MAG: diguanylate cyclase [Sphingomonas sp.]